MVGSQHGCACWRVGALLALLAGAVPSHAGDPNPLRVIVMDPLCDRLACDCVQGYAQRKYDRLAEFLGRQLRRPVRLAYAESVAAGLEKIGGKADLIVGKQSLVLFDAARAKITVRPMARLTGKAGNTDLTGLFVVRTSDSAKRIADLKGYRILFGPKYADEKHAAALAALKAHGIPAPQRLETSRTCNNAAIAVVDKEADAAVISSYAYALLEGCKTVQKGALRVVGQTDPLPFVTVFATESVTAEEEKAIFAALRAVRTDKRLLAAMESRDGFVPASTRRAPAAHASPTPPLVEWTGWRGPVRHALSPHVPDKLPKAVRFLWRRPLTGMGLSGIAATQRHVIVADKDQQKQNDVFRCLDADSGEQLWSLAYPASGEMDFSNSPRATPVIHDGLVYLLGAFGDLHCVRLDSGQTVWRKNIVKDFGAELVKWGTCATPLIVDDKLIVNPGARDAALVALDRHNGNVVWRTPGAPAAYSSFIIGTFGNVRQIVGYDAESLGGWDPETGKRLWKLVPPKEGDFNVPTPINVDGQLLVTTENNGTRLYEFDERGRIRPRPIAQNRELRPDSSTPVALNGMLFGCTVDLYCLDLGRGLRELWHQEDDVFEDYTTFIAGNDRVLVFSAGGDLLLVRADRHRYTLESRLRLFEDSDTWSHPALVGDRLYVRTRSEVCCVLLSEP